MNLEFASPKSIMATGLLISSSYTQESLLVETLVDLYITLYYFLFSVQFEGSLGCLTTASVHNPRRIIKLTSEKMHIHSNDFNAKDSRKYKQLLLSIEQVSTIIQ